MKSPESIQESLSLLTPGHVHHVQPQPKQKVQPELKHRQVGLTMPLTYMYQETPPLGLAKQPPQHLTEARGGKEESFLAM